MADTRILLIGSPDNDSLIKVLGRQGRSLTRIEDPEKLASVGNDHNVIVIESVLPPKTVADVCRELRANPDLAEVPVLAVSATDEVEERIRLLEAGADDVMIRPIDERELDARVEALDLRHRRSKELRPAGPSTVVAPTRRPGRRLIAVYSPKGGVGTTTVAVNLALAISAREPERVALVDLTPMGGQVATQLDLRPKLTVAELVRDSQGTITSDVLRSTYLTRDERGISVLAGSAGPTAQPLMSGGEASRILEAVIAALPTVVVDLGSHLDERVMAAIDAADDLVVVVTPDFPALKSVHQFFEFLGESGKATEPTIVVNETYALQTLTPADVENALARRVTIRLPYDPLLYLRAVNQGTPVFASAATSQPARRFDQLAAVLLGEDAPPAQAETRRRGLAGIFGRS
ncbi:MAG TPA: AAA family ATPase [Candidatus Limnocylindrales bacterium]|nr:AAA family ATPase [Candidatus Limnocylindrales bacterium]